MKIKIKQHLSSPSKIDIDTTKQLILLLPESITSGKWPTVAYKKELAARLKRDPESAKMWSIDLPNSVATQVNFATVATEISQFEILTLARKLVAAQLASNPQQLSIAMPGLPAKLVTRLADAFLNAVLAASATMPSFKSKKSPTSKLKTLDLYNQKTKFDTRAVEARAAGNTLARQLTALPPNELTPGIYRNKVQKLARHHGWKMQFHNMANLRKQHAGAFVAVAQGSAENDAGIVHLRYTPKKPSKKPACALVGKGICFDTGGTNLKPSNYMLGMHEDMQGSAVALGTLLALSELKVDFPVDCWLALAQNHIGPKAYKQNDVVTASNGKTIEVMHTDAEGRMVLADTLVFAARKKPALIIDYATLTGCCVVALGTNYSGAFTNRDALHADIIRAGKDSGERVWPFPIDADYDEDLESKIADTKQCTVSGGPDHIQASRFLQLFVDDTPWCHIDLSAGNHKGGLAHIDTDYTGFGIGFTLELLLNRKVLENPKALAKK